MMRTIRLVTAALTLFTFTTGCVDREQLKADVLQAIKLQEQVSSYRFSGSASMDIAAPEKGFTGNPLSSALMSMLMKGDLSWQGVASVEPLQVEATLQLKPQGRSDAYQIPLLIKDNKLYIHIPAMNKDGQFVEVDFAALREMSGRTSGSEMPLSEAGQLFAAISEELVKQIHVKRFDEKDSAEGNNRIITAAFEQKQAKEAIRVWFQAMPSILDQLANSGYMTTDKLEAAKARFNADNQAKWEKNSDQLTFNQPASLSFQIDKNGFIREMNGDADVSLQTEDGGKKNYSVHIVNRYDDINANPPFTMDVPVDVIPFTQILKFMNSGK